MKSVVLLLTFSLILNTSAVASEGPDSSLLKKYPGHLLALKNYQNRFRRLKLLDSESGDQIAAQILFGESEEELSKLGVSLEDLGALQREVMEDLEKEKTTLSQKIEADAVLDLAEKIDTMNVSEIEARLSPILKRSAVLSSRYQQIPYKPQPYWQKDNVRILVYKVSVSFLLLSDLEERHSSKELIRAMDALLTEFESLIARTGATPDGLAVSAVGKETLQALIKRWSFLHPKEASYRYADLIRATMKWAPKLTLGVGLPLSAFIFSTRGDPNLPSWFMAYEWASVAAVVVLLNLYVWSTLKPQFKVQNANNIRNTGFTVLEKCPVRMGTLQVVTGQK